MTVEFLPKGFEVEMLAAILRELRAHGVRKFESTNLGLTIELDTLKVVEHADKQKSEPPLSGFVAPEFPQPTPSEIRQETYEEKLDRLHLEDPAEYERIIELGESAVEPGGGG